MRPLRWLLPLSALVLLPACAELQQTLQPEAQQYPVWQQASHRHHRGNQARRVPPAVQAPADVAAPDQVVAEVVSLTNQERAAQGLPPLELDEALLRAAQGHANNMASRQQMEHELDGQSVADRVSAQGYQWRYVAENIAEGQESPQEVVQDWMNSPGHRRNILSARARQIGVGYARAGNRIYWCQDFGQPR